MAPRRRISRKESNESFDDDWKKHDIYGLDTTANRMLTRSQAAFIRLRNTESDLELFADAKRHHPPGFPHLMMTLKGPLGAVPRTIVTHDVAQYLPVSKELCERVNMYKTAKLNSVDNGGNKTRRKRNNSKRRKSRRRG